MIVIVLIMRIRSLVLMDEKKNKLHIKCKDISDEKKNKLHIKVIIYF